MMKLQFVFFTMFVCSLTSLLFGADTIYDDGGTYNISTMVWDGIVIYDSPDGLPTTVNLLTGNMQQQTGGRVQHGMDVYDFSEINILGGWVSDSVNGHDNSYVEMSDGLVGAWFDAYDQSKLVLSGGTVANWVRAYNNSIVEIKGGRNNGFYIADLGVGFVTGGIFDNEIWSIDDGRVYISGGEIRKGLEVGGNSISYITGGNFDVTSAGSKNLKAYQNGTIYISGTDFNYSYGEIIDRSGTLTGTLANGNSLDEFFSIYDNGRIILVPEPCTLVLLGVGGLALRGKQRR